MYAKNMKDVTKRLLLHICIEEVTGSAVLEQDMQQMLEKQVQGRPSYPVPYLLMRQADIDAIKNTCQVFQGLYHDQTILSHAIEAMSSKQFSCAVALIEQGK